MNYTLNSYVFVAPIYFGLMNMLSKYMQEEFDLTDTERFLYIGLISGTLIPLLAYVFKTYNFTQRQWLSYSVRIFLMHMFDYNVLLRGIEYLIGV